MIAIINDITYDISKPFDISLPLSPSLKNPRAWYIDPPVIEPVQMGDWIGAVSKGASTNFNNIFFNPHAHGTHTECLGHITQDFYSIAQCLKTFLFPAQLISIKPLLINGDLVISAKQIADALDLTLKGGKAKKALIIRTLPNEIDKKNKNYSHTNPPYLLEETAKLLKDLDIQHLLIDLPSIDREKDEGKLLAHKAFWHVKDTKNLNNDARFYATITEFVFIDDDILDGDYLLNLQITSIENDASPSKPILYKKII
jgi:kynurenine formamidase